MSLNSLSKRTKSRLRVLLQPPSLQRHCCLSYSERVSVLLTGHELKVCSIRSPGLRYLSQTSSYHGSPSYLFHVQMAAWAKMFI